MNGHPIELLEPVLRWLDWLIAEHGHYLYLAMVWASPFVIAWTLRGGFWRRRTSRQRGHVLAPVLLVPIASPPSQSAPPPLPKIIKAKPQSPLTSDSDTQSFSA